MIGFVLAASSSSAASKSQGGPARPPLRAARCVNRVVWLQPQSTESAHGLLHFHQSLREVERGLCVGTERASDRKCACLLLLVPNLVVLAAAATVPSFHLFRILRAVEWEDCNHF